MYRGDPFGPDLYFRIGIEEEQAAGWILAQVGSLLGLSDPKGLEPWLYGLATDFPGARGQLVDRDLKEADVGSVLDAEG